MRGVVESFRGLSPMVKKVIAAVVVVVVVLGVVGGVVLYRHNTTVMCEQAVAGVQDAGGSFDQAQDEAKKAVAAAYDTQANEYVAGFATPLVDGKLPAGVELTDGDKLIADIHDKLADSDVAGSGKPLCVDRSGVRELNAQADVLTKKSDDLRAVTKKLNDELDKYVTAKMIETAQAKMAESVTSRDTALSTAQTAIDSANATAGFADNADNAALIADVQAKLDAAKNVDVDNAATTREEAQAVLDKIVAVDQATAVLNDSVTALTNQVNAYAAQKAQEAAAQRAAQRAAQHNYTRSNSNGYTQPAPAPAPAPSDDSGESMTWEEMMHAVGIDPNVYYRCQEDPDRCS